MSCIKPYVIRNKKGELQQVGCGRCPNCYYRNIAGWTFRLMQEDKVSESSHFITLTYDADNLVTTPFGRPSICKYDLQNFFKRLRKHQQSGSICSGIKYYAVGEYGSRTGRPHYHAILFNAELNAIEKAWTKGHIHFAQVGEESIGYTLKYLNKRRTIGLIGDDDRHPEFRLSSQGLGISYIKQSTKSWHLADLHNRSYITLRNGIKAAMPRYLRDKIYDGYQKDLLAMSGSLIQQDEFFKQFTTKSYEQRMQENKLFEIRVEAAFRRHEHSQKKLLPL